METKRQDLLQRVFDFGVQMLVFLSGLKYNEVLSVPKKQLARACVSIGANYEESQAAETKKDFIHKIGIVCKECRESHYWIRILRAIYNEKEAQQKLEKFQQEALEFRKIFSAIKMSAEGKKYSTQVNMSNPLPPLNFNP